MVHIHTMEYYSVILKNEVLIHAVLSWMNLEIMVYVKEARHKKSHVA